MSIKPDHCGSKRGPLLADGSFIAPTPGYTGPQWDRRREAQTEARERFELDAEIEEARSLRDRGGL